MIHTSRCQFSKGTVIVNRGPLILDEASGEVEFNQTACFQGRAIHRVYPGGMEMFLRYLCTFLYCTLHLMYVLVILYSFHEICCCFLDVIGIQKRMHGGLYPGLETTKPPFDLPIVYEDNHFAIVNK